MAPSPTDPFAKHFPTLASSGYDPKSPEDKGYNCIAWAAGDNQNWWWPDPMDQYYWPPGVSRSLTIDAFIAAYRSRGFELCDGPELERGFEKVAIFALGDTPTHAARQLENGQWTSKLGTWVDIEHAILEGVSGPTYGRPVRVLRRQRVSPGIGCLAVSPLLLVHAWVSRG
jgi:hypothetical protein